MSGRLVAVAIAGAALAVVLWLVMAPQRAPSRETASPSIAGVTGAPDQAVRPAPSVEQPVGPPVLRPHPGAPPLPESAATATPARAAPATGTLRVDSDVPGADVFIDRVFIGKTPVTASRIAPGAHRLNVSAPGWDGFADTIEVAPGPRDVMIRLKEVRLDASIDVVHEHRLGSCRGRLSATPQGLRYQTDNRGDAFEVPLQDLEGFSVDYMAKRLTVRIRGGRKYEFADPQGNADRLFVFHRAVDEAREQLKKAR